MGRVKYKKADGACFLPAVLSVSGAAVMLVSGWYICRLAGAFLLLAGLWFNGEERDSVSRY